MTTVVNKEQVEKEYESKQKVMPTHRDLADAKRYGYRILRFSPYAVHVKKISQKHREDSIDATQLKEMKELLEVMTTEHKYDFLVDFQYAEKMELSSNDMKFMEKSQQVSSLKHMCMIERSPLQKADALDAQIKEWKSRNPNKELVVVSEVFTDDVLGKIKVAKDNGIKKYAIKFRSFHRYKKELQSFLGALKVANMTSIVFGVFPKKWENSASMLLPALYYQADYVSAYIPNGGGPSPITYLCDDWMFKTVSKISEGLTDYEGKKREDIMKSKSNLVLFSRIDALNEANMLLSTKRLTKVLFETLFE
jgi:hypothetical protein